jgi:hypothetical protein
MTRLQEQVWDVLVSLDGETLLQAFTSYHGMQILDGGLAEYLVDEGLMEPGDEDEEDEEGSKECPEMGTILFQTAVHWAAG